MSDVPATAAAAPAPSAEAPKSELDKLLDGVERAAKRKPSEINNFVTISLLPLLRAMRAEYNEGFDATFATIEEVRDAAGDEGDDDAIDLLKQSAGVIVQLSEFLDGILVATGWVTPTEVSPLMPPEQRAKLEELKGVLAAHLSEVREFVEAAESDEADEDDEDGDDEAGEGAGENALEA